MHFEKSMGASLTCVKWSEPPLFDQNQICYEEGSLDYYRSAIETITQTEFCIEIYSSQTMGATFYLPLKTIKEGIYNTANTKGSTDGQI